MRFRRSVKKVELSQDAVNNMFIIDGEEHFLEYIDAADIRQGGNSSVFRAVHHDGDDSYVVKFCRYPMDTTYRRDIRRISRFEREIRALRLARNSPESRCVIPIVQDGEISLSSDSAGRPATLKYYVMEEADSDLSKYLEENDLELQQKLMLCDELLKILKGLHALGIYHRDIKPENILMRERRPVFGDLGLIAYRVEDHDLDEFDEKIGPIGYLSPEATNKGLGLRTKASFTFDCTIDAKSDIFQLGQVFWLVLQDEVPTGHLLPADLRFGAGAGILERVIQPMLQYGKQRRANLVDVETALEPVLREVAVI